MTTLQETKRQLQDLKPILKEKFKVETIEIFGSYARQAHTPESDIDLLVTYSQPPDIVEVNRLKRFLRRKLHRKVDVVSKKYLNPLIKDQILQEAIPI